jgi:hypothetical protein
MRVTWRFYRADGGEWRWQQIGEEQSVLSESKAAYPSYEACVAAAISKGYVFEKTQGKTTRPGNQGFQRR